MYLRASLGVYLRAYLGVDVRVDISAYLRGCCRCCCGSCRRCLCKLRSLAQPRKSRLGVAAADSQGLGPAGQDPRCHVDNDGVRLAALALVGAIADGVVLVVVLVLTDAVVSLAVAARCICIRIVPRVVPKLPPPAKADQAESWRPAEACDLRCFCRSHCVEGVGGYTTPAGPLPAVLLRREFIQAEMAAKTTMLMTTTTITTTMTTMVT